MTFIRQRKADNTHEKKTADRLRKKQKRWQEKQRKSSHSANSIKH